MNNKKGNIIYFPQGYPYAIVFYNNYDGYFLVDADKVPLVKQHTWTCDKTRFEPITIINGKKTRLSRFLNATPSNLVCDHINCCVADNRTCNLRNCTPEQNNFNRERFAPKVEQVGNKYTIKNLSKSPFLDVLFDTSEEAEQTMYAIIDSSQGEFSYWRSQEIATANKTNEFVNHVILGGIFEEINMLPEINIFKRILRNILRDYDNGKITDEQFLREWRKLESYYFDYKKEPA